MKRRYACEGPKLNVAFAVGANGKQLAEEFLNERSDEDKAKLYALFKRLADRGSIMNNEKFKKLEGRIWEFKSHQCRMFCGFVDQRTVLLTHGCIKKKDKADPAEISRAKRILDEDAERVLTAEHEAQKAVSRVSIVRREIKAPPKTRAAEEDGE